MKDTPEIRDRLITLIGKGAEANILLQKLDPAFVELREHFRGKLVQSVRQNAQDREIIQNACLITALEEIYDVFYQDAATGARAQKAATQLEAENG